MKRLKKRYGSVLTLSFLLILIAVVLEMIITGKVHFYDSMAVLGLVGIASSLIGSWLKAKQTRSVTDDLSQKTDTIQECAGRLIRSTTSLADESGHETAQFQQASSCLEQAHYEARQMSGKAQEAEKIADETCQQAVMGNQVISMVSNSIRELKDCSEETVRIVKVVDEIAFQTNLLALNAAVEAARAGEAGKSFAVVAAEVRSLASRSAQASQNTAEMLEKAARQSENCAGMISEVERVFNVIAESVEKITGLIKEMSLSTQAQTDKIQQVSQISFTMNKSIESHTENARESASSGQNLLQQIEQMKAMMDQVLSSQKQLSNQAPV